MAPRNSIPLGGGFYPDWWHKQYGISFDRKYYFDPEARIAARLSAGAMKLRPYNFIKSRCINGLFSYRYSS